MIMSREHKTLLMKGRKLAMKRGVKMGRKPKLSLDQVKEVVEAHNRGVEKKYLAERYQVSFATISRIVNNILDYA